MSSPFGAEPVRRRRAAAEPAVAPPAVEETPETAGEVATATADVSETAAHAATVSPFAPAAPHTLVTGTTLLAPPVGPPGPPPAPATTTPTRRAAAPPPLRIGRHEADGPALHAMADTGTGAGLVLGYDNENRPVAVRVFRPEGTRVALVGGLWIAQLVAVRAMAVGARVTVVTTRPDAWVELGVATTGQADRLQVAGDPPTLPVGSPRAPSLLVHDGDELGLADRSPLGPWQTRLTVTAALTTYGLPAVRDADLLVTQRLSEAEAAGAPAMDLDAGTARLLQMLQDDMIALISGGTARYVWTVPTEQEQVGLGPPTR